MGMNAARLAAQMEHVRAERRVMRRALQARRPRTHYTVGMDARGMQLAKSIVPQRVIDRVLARTMDMLKPVNGQAEDERL